MSSKSPSPSSSHSIGISLDEKEDDNSFENRMFTENITNKKEKKNDMLLRTITFNQFYLIEYNDKLIEINVI